MRKIFLVRFQFREIDGLNTAQKIKTVIYCTVAVENRKMFKKLKTSVALYKCIPYSFFVQKLFAFGKKYKNKLAVDGA